MYSTDTIDTDYGKVEVQIASCSECRKKRIANQIRSNGWVIVSPVLSVGSMNFIGTGHVNPPDVALRDVHFCTMRCLVDYYSRVLSESVQAQAASASEGER